MKLGNLRFLKDIVIRAKTGCGCGRQSREADCKLEGGVVLRFFCLAGLHIGMRRKEIGVYEAITSRPSRQVCQIARLTRSLIRQ